MHDDDPALRLRSRARRHAPHRADVPAGLLHRQLPDQPVDASRRPHRHQPRRHPVGGPLRQVPRARLRRAADRRAARACPTWSTRPTAASCSTASPTAPSSTTRSASPRARPTWSGSRANGFTVAEPVSTNEGEGDFLLVGDTIFAGTGFRSDAASHDELRKIYGREVVTLTLVNPSFYHLDTALAVLDSNGGPALEHRLPAQAPSTRPSLAILRERFPDAIHRERSGRRRARPQLVQRRLQRGHRVARHRLRAPAARARLQPASASTSSELLLGGGGVKCCTLELRR